MFIDEIKVFASAGKGGRGCVAFQREAYRPKGGPSGGNGGRGGNVILQADHDINNLIAQFYDPKLIAQDGENGKGKGMDGHAGKDRIVKVPCGTLVWGAAAEPETPATAAAGSGPAVISASGSPKPGRPVLRASASVSAVEVDLAEAPPSPSAPPDGCAQGELVIDLTEHGQQFTLCRGGRGGLGNRNFATARRQAPRFAQPGEPGEAGWFHLELRLMADVGLVGYPNAGKSTLLSAISQARPRIAPYPFTTLHPQVGIVEFPDYHRLVVCDVPGIIEGAHRNVGLGHAFLRHIQRCRVLVLLLDMAGADGRKPWDDYRNLIRELELYDPRLAEKPRLICANKMDEPAAALNLRQFKRRVPKTPILTMAAGFGEGVMEFKQLIRQAIADPDSIRPKARSRRAPRRS